MFKTRDDVHMCSHAVLLKIERQRFLMLTLGEIYIVCRYILTPKTFNSFSNITCTHFVSVPYCA